MPPKRTKKRSIQEGDGEDGSSSASARFQYLRLRSKRSSTTEDIGMDIDESSVENESNGVSLRKVLRADQLTIRSRFFRNQDFLETEFTIFTDWHLC